MDFNEKVLKISKEREEEQQKRRETFLAQRKEARSRKDRRMKAISNELKTMKIDIQKWGSFIEQLDKEREPEIKKIRDKYIKDSSKIDSSISARYLESAPKAILGSNNTQIIPPAFASIYSMKDPEDKLSESTETQAFNPGDTVDAYCWAKGGGTGHFPGNDASISVDVEWGFWFMPNENGSYRIIPHDVLHGFYIIKSDDGVLTSHWADLAVFVETRVYQDFWRNSVSAAILIEADDNIDKNSRFDREYDQLYRAELAGGIWAFARNVITLYCFANGSSAYAELNFSDGVGNYVQCPHIHVSKIK
jgi:hypothetical protein